MKKYYGYEAKVIASGEMLEIYFYDEELQKKVKDDESEITDDEPKKRIPKPNDGLYKRSQRSANRSKMELERLINANIGQYDQKDKFITLTFKEFVDRDTLVKQFKRFNERLKYKVGNDYEYIAVIERGTKGTQRLHLHVVFFNLPFIKASAFRKIWKYGNVKMNAVKENAIASYMTKYVQKTLTDTSYIPKSKKFYMISQNLKKPKIGYMDTLEAVKLVEQYEKLYPGKVALTDFDFESDYVGKCRYVKIGYQTKTSKPLIDEMV